MAELYTLIAPDTDSVLLGEGNGKVKSYWKQLVKYGTFADPHNRAGKKMTLDATWGAKIVQNFNDKVVGRVPVPLGHPETAADLASLNRGELTQMESRPDGLWGKLEIRDPKTIDDIDNDLIWDVSISFANDYCRTSDGKEVGPTMFHVGLLTDPYIKGMSPFAAALSNGNKAIMLSESKEPQSMSKVKNNKDFAVTVEYKDGDWTRSRVLNPGEELEVPEAVEADLLAQVEAAQKPEETKDETDDQKVEEKPADDKKDETPEAKADGAADEREKALADREQAVAVKEAETTYNTLLNDGKIVPAQKDAFIALSLSAPSTISLSDGSTKSLSDMITDLFAKAPKRISFGEGKQSDSDGTKASAWDQLSDGEREQSQKLGITKDEYDKLNSTNNDSTDETADDED